MKSVFFAVCGLLSISVHAAFDDQLAIGIPVASADQRPPPFSSDLRDTITRELDQQSQIVEEAHAKLARKINEKIERKFPIIVEQVEKKLVKAIEKGKSEIKFVFTQHIISSEVFWSMISDQGYKGTIAAESKINRALGTKLLDYFRARYSNRYYIDLVYRNTSGNYYKPTLKFKQG